MNLSELKQYLYQLNVYEKAQKETGININDYTNYSDEKSYLDPKLHILRMPKNMFFKPGQNIFVSKHNRFAPMQEHLHDFIELNYMYSGSCLETIHGQQVRLNPGDFCFLDRNVPHALAPLGQDDILINILVNEETFSSLFMAEMQNDSSLQAQILSDMFQKQTEHDRYVIFKTKDSAVHTLVQLLLMEYWSFQRQADFFLSRYLQLIIMELTRIYSKEQIDLQTTSTFDYEAVLKYIDDNYQKLTLEQLAEHFGYNGNYLSNMLKKKTGRNFQTIILEKRLMVACHLLINTDYSMDLISQQAGFNSTSYFFRQFKRHYQLTPNTFRKTKR